MNHDALHTDAALARLIKSTHHNAGNSIFEVGPAIMAPFASTSMEQRISSVTRVSANKYTLNWSRSWTPDGGAGTKMNKPLVIADAGIPADMFPANGDSIIVAEAYYKYSSPFQQFLPAAAGARLLKQQGQQAAAKEPHPVLSFFLDTLVPRLLHHVVSAETPANLAQGRIFDGVFPALFLGLLRSVGE